MICVSEKWPKFWCRFLKNKSKSNFNFFQKLDKNDKCFQVRRTPQHSNVQGNNGAFNFLYPFLRHHLENLKTCGFRIDGAKRKEFASDIKYWEINKKIQGKISRTFYNHKSQIFNKMIWFSEKWYLKNTEISM